MKQSAGFTRMGWSALTGGASGFYQCRCGSCRSRTAHTVWTKTGAVGAYVPGLALLGEPANLARIVAATMIVGDRR